MKNSQCSEIFYHNDSLYYLGNANGYSDEAYDYRDIPYGLFRLDENGLEANWIDAQTRNHYNPLFYGDYVYYTNSYDDHIYRSELSQTEDLGEQPPFIRARNDNSYGTPYLIIDDWIYTFVWVSGSPTKVAGIRLDGSSMQTIINDGTASRVQLYEGNIYYTVTDNKNQKRQLRRVKPDGTNDEFVIEEPIKQYVIYNGTIFYIDSDYYHIYRINIDGTGKILLADTAVSDFAIKNNRIYYSDMYDHGTIHSLESDGKNPRKIVDVSYEYINSYDYQTKGVDNLAKKEQYNQDISYSPSEVLSFEDPEFEEFLCVMFNKDPGTITGADLLSVKFFGYYEGAPTKKSSLANHGNSPSLFENCVFYSTDNITGSFDITEMFSGNIAGDTLAYRQNCTKLSVISNEWMARHVMPYLYYFKNLEYVLFGYCWAGDNTHFPFGADVQYVNTHSRYVHDPY